MRRAFTLIEVLVVVLLIVLITAIAGPLAISEVGRASMREAERQVEAAAMLARADAQRRGVVLQLVALAADESKGVGVELRTIDLTDGRGSTRDVARVEDAILSTDRSGEGTATLGTNVGGEAPHHRSVLFLPSSVRMMAALPREREETDVSGSPVRSDRSSLGAEPEDAGSSTEDGSESEAPLVVCIFFPDGQIVANTPRYLVSRSGQAVSIQINRWTGRVTATKIERKSSNTLESESDGAPVHDAPGASAAGAAKSGGGL